jgi:hypothetical protein
MLRIRTRKSFHGFANSLMAMILAYGVQLHATAFVEKGKITPGGGRTNVNPSLRVSNKDIIDYLNAVVRYDRAILAPS